MAEVLQVVVEDDDATIHVDPDTGTITEDQPDGGVVVKLDAYRKSVDAKDKDDWFRNLVDDIDIMTLGGISNDLYSAIEADDRSRMEYLETRARGFEMLGIKLEKPTSDTEAGVEGMSKVTNPLMLEAILKGWANAQAELLPATGPCKIRNDSIRGSKVDDELAEAYERGINHYLTVTAPEYYPDTSHMLLWGTYYGGSGFKKIYRCPMRRRPVSESVDAKDLIVSDTMKDFASCARITHQISMRPSVMKRMQLLGVYRDIPLTPPNAMPNVVDNKIAGIQGTEAKPSRPEDQPFTIWETQCELDIAEYAPGKFKDEGIPLPYLVTLDKDTREILSITRDWDEDDDDCRRLRMYVRYPYVPGPGFYGTGMLGILGNSSAAMTAAWREALDAGMFANFPAGLMAKLGGRQNSATFRLAPGEFAPIETNGQPISQIFSGLPYKDVTPGLLALIDKITDQAKSVGSAADIPAGEGLQNVPVGTMLANIEQATKVMAAAHKGMHQAQGEELRLFVRLFRQHPEDFWLGNTECPHDYWDAEKLIQALDNCDLVPVSDPNIPSHLHRVGKALALTQLVQLPPFAARLDPDELLRRVLVAIREDPNGLMVQAPPQEMAPEDQAKLLTAQAKMQEVTAKTAKIDVDRQTAQIGAVAKMREVEANQRIKDADVTTQLIIHQAEVDKMHSQERRDELAAQLKRISDGQKVHSDRQKNQIAARKQVADEHFRQKELELEARKIGLDAMSHMDEHGLAERVADHEAKLGVASHQLESRREAHDAAISAHEALNPPNKERKKKSHGGGVAGDVPDPMLEDDDTFYGDAFRVIRRTRREGGRVVLVDQNNVSLTQEEEEMRQLKEVMGPLAEAIQDLRSSIHPPVDTNASIRDMAQAIDALGRDMRAERMFPPEPVQIPPPAQPEVFSALASALDALGKNLTAHQKTLDRTIVAVTAPRVLVRDAQGKPQRSVVEMPPDPEPVIPVNVVIDKE